MIGVMAFMVFAMMIVGLLLMAIAGCVIELICSREEAQEIKEEWSYGIYGICNDDCRIAFNGNRRMCD